MSMQDIMVDLETTGTDGVRSAIIQLAAVRFDLRTRQVDHNFFNMSLQVPNWRFWSESTRTWWMQQKRAILEGIMAAGQDPGYVMQEFAKWCSYKEPLRLWAKPTSFEWPYIQSYFEDFNVHNPFDFRTAVDCRSYLNGLTKFEPYILEKELPFSGDAHNALYDVLHQIKWLFANEDKFGRPAEPIEATAA